MKWLLLLLVVCNLSIGSPLQIAAEIEKEISSETRDFPKLKKRVDAAMTQALKIAAEELKKKGHGAEAEDILRQWSFWYGSSLQYANRNKNIGDHKPISEWVKEKYNIIEFILGVELCKKLHISDIKSLNHGFPVVVNPCVFPMDSVQGTRIDEYKRHFCGGPSGDDTYYGVVPVLTYWAAYIGCGVGTSGVGASGVGFIGICGLAGTLAERIIGFVADDISDKLFTRMCK